jgi:thioredoxin 1
MPILDEAAQAFSGKIKVVTVDVDEHKKRMAEYGFRVIPSFVFLKRGKVVAKQPGFPGKDGLFRLIQQHL